MNEEHDTRKALSRSSVYMINNWIESCALNDVTKGPGMSIERRGSVTDETVEDIQNELACTLRKIVYWKEKDVHQFNNEITSWNASVQMLWLSRTICTETRDMLFLLPLCTNFYSSPFADLFHDDAREIIDRFIF